jgi:hypothetical protein
MLDVQFILPGLLDNWYSFGAWWVFGYSTYMALITACITIIDSYSSFVAFFKGDFSQSYKNGAQLCNDSLAPMW